MEPVSEEVLCCQYAAVSLSPITADNFLEFSFFNKHHEQSIFSTSSTNSANRSRAALGDEAEHSVFQFRYHYLILDVAEVKRLKKPPQGNKIKK